MHRYSRADFSDFGNFGNSGFVGLFRYPVVHPGICVDLSLFVLQISLNVLRHNVAVSNRTGGTGSFIGFFGPLGNGFFVRPLLVLLILTVDT